MKSFEEGKEYIFSFMIYKHDLKIKYDKIWFKKKSFVFNNLKCKLLFFFFKNGFDDDI